LSALHCHLALDCGPNPGCKLSLMAPVANSTVGKVTSAAGAVAGIGGSLTAAAVLSCCSGVALGPLVVALFGASAAVGLATLASYAIPLLALSGAMIGLSLWSAIRRTRCSSGKSGGLARKLSLSMLFAASAVWVAATVLIIYSQISARLQ
jgi:hypothetical protein